MQLVAFTLLAGAVGGLAGYGLALLRGRHYLNTVRRESEQRLTAITEDQERFAAKYRNVKAVARELRDRADKAVARHDAAIEKLRVMARNVQALRAERATTKEKVKTLQNSLTALHRRSLSLQREFDKASTFYKRELTNAFNRRRQLEAELEAARAEQAAFQKRIKESVLEHGSPEEMITAAQLRFGQIEMLERAIDRLESEKSELKEDARRLKADYDELQDRLRELDELKIHNQQLVRCVESLEQSRQQHEQEAEQYRSQADESEQLSETLRMRLDDLEQSFAAIEQDQEQAMRQIRDTRSGTAANQDGSDDRSIVELAEYSKRR